ncbi:MAG: CDP-alcohol phosphatidyltransferase family protein [Pseudomonadota bacterium]
MCSRSSADVCTVEQLTQPDIAPINFPWLALSANGKSLSSIWNDLTEVTFVRASIPSFFIALASSARPQATNTRDDAFISFLISIGVGLAALVGLQAVLFAPVLSIGLLASVAFYTMSVAGFVRRFPVEHHSRILGLANVVTTFRLVVTGVLVAAIFHQSPVSWSLFGLAAINLALDGVDGWLARYQGSSSPFGARFDVEVDSLFALTLALVAWLNADMPFWIVALGLPRYIFFIAQQVFPWLAGDLPPRFSRKLACVLQIGALIALLVPNVPLLLAHTAAAAALAIVAWSFAVDIRHLRQSMV